MSADEPDSLIRAVAAAPPKAAPIRRVTAVLVDASGEAAAVARASALSRSIGARVDVLPDERICITPADDDGAPQAAACALALRDAFSRARIVLATGPSRAAAIERATNLLNGALTDVIRIDETTADLLDVTFEVRNDFGERILVGKRDAKRRAGRWAPRARLGAGMLTLWVVILVLGRIAASSRTSADDAIAGSCELLRDPTGSLSASEAAVARGWQPLGTSHPNLGFSRDVLWLRFEVMPRFAGNLDGILDATREWVEDVDFYEVENGAVKSSVHSGARVPLARRPVPTERIVFPLSLAAGKTQTLLLRIHSASPISFTARIISRSQFELEKSIDELLFGGYYAVLAAVAAYSLVLFWMLRDRTQLLVGTLLLGWCLVEATSHGHLSRLEPGLAGTIELRGGAAAFSIWAISMLLLVFQATAPTGTWSRILAATTWIVGVLTAAPVLAPVLFPLIFVGLSLAVVAILSAIFSCDREDPGFLFLGMAVGALVVPGTMTLATLFGLVAARPETEYGNHIGAVFMAILFSLLVGQTIRAQHASITSLNEELRRQIGDRARQLAAALARLSASPAEGFAAGMIVADRYRVKRRIGGGGMGTVYEVERMRDGQRLALKTIKRVADREALARFAREAQIMAALDHCNIVSVVDVDVASTGTIFLVMELIDGPTLSKEKNRWGDAAWARLVLQQIAQALAAMHARGIVHRDLKPENVLFDGTIVKVTDFGISSLRTEEREDSTLAKGLTRTGVIMGTPMYMAPELADGAGAAGAPADVWSFGVLAHELLTGNTPFREPPIMARLERRDALASLTVGNEELRGLIVRCLDHRPEARPSADELVATLQT